MTHIWRVTDRDRDITQDLVCGKKKKNVFEHITCLNNDVKDWSVGSPEMQVWG